MRADFRAWTRQQNLSQSFSEPGAVLDLAGLRFWRARHPGEAVQLRSWAGAPSCGCLDDICRSVEDLGPAPLVSFIPTAEGWQDVVSAFLHRAPAGRAVAFVARRNALDFRRDWGHILQMYSGHLVAVEVDLHRDVDAMGLGSERGAASHGDKMEREAYLLGRVATRAMCSKKAIAWGGGSYVALEAERSRAEGVDWTVYAARDSPADEPSIADWAASSDAAAGGVGNVSLVLGRGEHAKEGMAFDNACGLYFPVWRQMSPGKITCIRGWRMLDPGSTKFAWGGCQGSVLERAADLLSTTSVLVFVYDEGTVDPVLKAFLRDNPSGMAVAFVPKEQLSSSKHTNSNRWLRSLIAEYPQRLAVVPVDLQRDAVAFGILEKLPDAREILKAHGLEGEEDRYRLGCIAREVTGSTQVLALGGDHVLALEAGSSLESEAGAHWTIFALSNPEGKPKENRRAARTPTLLDWAAGLASEHSDRVTFMRGLDPSEDLAFANSCRHHKEPLVGTWYLQDRPLVLTIEPKQGGVMRLSARSTIGLKLLTEAQPWGHPNLFGAYDAHPVPKSHGRDDVGKAEAAASGDADLIVDLEPHAGGHQAVGHLSLQQREARGMPMSPGGREMYPGGGMAMQPPQPQQLCLSLERGRLELRGKLPGPVHIRGDDFLRPEFGTVWTDVARRHPPQVRIVSCVDDAYVGVYEPRDGGYSKTDGSGAEITCSGLSTDGWAGGDMVSWHLGTGQDVLWVPDHTKAAFSRMLEIAPRIPRAWVRASDDPKGKGGKGMLFYAKGSPPLPGAGLAPWGFGKGEGLASAGGDDGDDTVLLTIDVLAVAVTLSAAATGGELLVVGTCMDGSEVGRWSLARSQPLRLLRERVRDAMGLAHDELLLASRGGMILPEEKDSSAIGSLFCDEL